MAGELSRPEYAARYGPTAGDRVRLGRHEPAGADRAGRDELRGRGAARLGEDPSHRDHDERPSCRPPASSTCSSRNVIVMDPVLGVFKANIGVKDGVIVGVGRAGNPDIVDNPDLLIGSNTAPVYGQGFIATPGGIDTHVHLVQPRLIPAALAAGMTTLDHRRPQRQPGLQPASGCSWRSSTSRSTWACSAGRRARCPTR